MVVKTYFRALAVLFFVVLLGAGALVWVFLDMTTGHVVVENGTEECLADCTVVLPGSRTKFENIMPGYTRDLWFTAERDGEYHIAVTFSSGEKLVDDVGYVTPNLGNRDRLIVSKDQIKLVRDRFPSIADVFRRFR